MMLAPDRRRRGLGWITLALTLVAPALGHAEAPALMFAGAAYADAKSVALRAPEGIACTDAGQVVVGDTANGRLVFFKWQDGAFTPARQVVFPELGNPARVQIDSSGNVLALDQKTRRIVRVGQAGEFAGYFELKGGPKAARPSFVGAFKLDRHDNLYLLDIGAHRIVVVGPDGVFQREVLLPKGALFTDIAIDRGETLFAIDAVTGQLYTAPRSADVLAPKGKPLKDFMNFPAYITPAENGRLTLVDKYGHGLVVIGNEGSFQGRQLSIGWSEGLIYYPAQICRTESGATFIADRGNNRIQAFVSSMR